MLTTQRINCIHSNCFTLHRDKCFNSFEIFLPEYIFLTFCYRYPWNWETPLGYSLSIAIQSVAVSYTAAVNQCPVLYHIEVCTFLSGFIWDMEKHLEDLNSSITKAPGKLSQRQRKMARIKFFNIMKFDAEIRELSSLKIMFLSGVESFGQEIVVFTSILSK